MPTIKIPVHAIIGDTTGITETQVQALLSGASTVYGSANLVFELASSEPITAGPELTDDNGAKGIGVAYHLARQAVAIRHSGKVVFFFLGTGPQSSEWADYAMVNGNSAMLSAHEVGHYLHLPHTFNDDITNAIHAANLKSGKAAALEVARNFIRTLGLGAFDGDSATVTDTLPDPGPPLFQLSGFDASGAQKVAQEECSGSGVFELDVDGQKIVFEPDRKNIMSYFFECPGSHHVSASQRLLIDRALTRLNRRHLTGSTYPEGPAALADGNHIHVFARGDDRSIWRTFRNPQNTWTGWFNDIGAGTFTSSPAAAMTGNHIHLFARADDRNIWHSFWNGQGWSGWLDNVGAGKFTSGPAAVGTPQQHMHLFARGDDGQVWHTSWTGQTWNGWQADIGEGKVTSQPAAIVTPGGLVYVFARGEDGNIWCTFKMGNTWSGWRDDLGKGTFTSGPGAVVSSGGNLHVFARGGDRAMWHTFWDGKTWSGWKANVAADVFMSGPAAVRTSDNQLHLFAQGDDRNIRHSLWNGQIWSAWTPDLGDGMFQP